MGSKYKRDDSKKGQDSFDSLSRKLGKFKRDSKTKLQVLKGKQFYEKPSEIKKRKLTEAQRKNKRQQMLDSF
tara:strand:- start:100 stop:315 length:216 start_codon:yes stop_codon:yes gene_type:complete